MKVTTALLIAVCLLGLVVARGMEVEEEEEFEVEEEDQLGVAHCVLYKELVAENDLLVAEKDFTVTYTVFSLGTAPCEDVSVRESVPSTDFEIVEGSPEQFWDKIEADSSESFNVTLRANKAGVWTPARAIVEYRDAGVGEDKSALSTTVGAVQILTPAQYARSTATFQLEWGLFAVVVLFAVVLPYNSYSSLKAAKKKFN